MNQQVYSRRGTRCKRLAHIVARLLGLVGALAIGGRVTAQTWDLCSDFSTEKNSGGSWTYGWKESAGGDFTAYDLLWGTQKECAIKGFFAPGWFGPVRAWCKTRADAERMVDALPPPGELYYPDHWVEANFQGEEVVRQAAGLPSYPNPTGFVAKNLSETAFGSWGYFWEPGMVLLMPPGSRGPQAEAVVRLDIACCGARRSRGKLHRTTDSGRRRHSGRSSCPPQ